MEPSQMKRPHSVRTKCIRMDSNSWPNGSWPESYRLVSLFLCWVQVALVLTPPSPSHNWFNVASSVLVSPSHSSEFLVHAKAASSRFLIFLLSISSFSSGSHVSQIQLPISLQTHLVCLPGFIEFWPFIVFSTSCSVLMLWRTTPP